MKKHWYQKTGASAAERLPTHFENALWGYWSLLKIVLPAVVVACVLFGAGIGVYWKFFRDTWEADNYPQLTQEYTQASNLKKEGKLDESVSLYAKVVGAIAVRAQKTPLEDQELIDLRVAASKDLDDARMLLDARNAVEQTKLANASSETPRVVTNFPPSPPNLPVNPVQSAVLKLSAAGNTASPPTIPAPANVPIIPTPATTAPHQTATQLFEFARRTNPGITLQGAIQLDEAAARDAVARELGPYACTDAATNAAILKKVAPLLARIEADADALTKNPGIPDNSTNQRVENFITQMKDDSYAVGAALGDAAAQAKIDALVASTNLDEAFNGKCFQAHVAFLRAGANTAAQSKALDQIANLGGIANLRYAATSVLMAMYIGNLATPQSRERIETMVTSGLDAKYKADTDDELGIALVRHKLAMMQDSPLIIEAKKLDGSDFSSELFKGKVILVHFWASHTNNGDMPRVEAVYKKYHPAGLEIIGVACDKNPDELKQFLNDNPDVSWTQLFNPTPSVDPRRGDLYPMEMPPLAAQYGIIGVPAMLLIDKKGVLRYTDARYSMEELIPKLLAE